MKANTLILLVCLSAGGAAGGLFLRGPEPGAGSESPGSRSRRPVPEGFELDDLPGPLIQSGSPYLNGRAGWFSEVFNGLVLDALGAGPPPSESPRVIIHRQPFSEGAWVEALAADQAETRRTTESQTVEAHVVVELPDVPGERLLQFLVFSGYQRQIEGIGKLERELSFPPLAAPPPELDGGFALEPHQFLCRERTQRPEFLAQPTGCYYLFDARRIGGAYLLRYDLLANAPVAGLSEKPPATIRLSTGQYVITPSDAGTRLHHVGFYSGQSMPALFDDFVTDHTIEYFEAMAEVIRSLAPSWEAPAEADEWARSALR